MRCSRASCLRWCVSQDGGHAPLPLEGATAAPLPGNRMRFALALLACMLQSGRPFLGAHRVAAGLAASSLSRCRRSRCSSIRAEVAEPEVAADTESGPTMDEVINVCKRRGIIFQSSEVCIHRPHPMLFPWPPSA